MAKLQEELNSKQNEFKEQYGNEYYEIMKDPSCNEEELIELNTQVRNLLSEVLKLEKSKYDDLLFELLADDDL